jgi:hypothetical protein
MFEPISNYLFIITTRKQLEILSSGTSEADAVYTGRKFGVEAHIQSGSQTLQKSTEGATHCTGTKLTNMYLVGRKGSNLFNCITGIRLTLFLNNFFCKGMEAKHSCEKLKNAGPPEAWNQAKDTIPYEELLSLLFHYIMDYSSGPDDSSFKESY